MPTERWIHRLFASTRGQIITRLRRRARTAGDLAETLDLTPNAIRAQLTKLERDGLVTAVGKRPGTRKPETLYGLTDAADALFPKAYDAVLREVIRVLEQRLDGETAERLLREAGRGLAPRLDGPPPNAPVRERIARVRDVLEDLGGLSEIESADGAVTIRGYRCPFEGAVNGNALVCRLAEALLEELAGVPVRQHCETEGDRPQCVFAFDPAGDAA